MSKAISNKIKVYNLILILWIFLYHSDAKYHLRLNYLTDILGPCGLSFFFMISGYFMFKGMNKDNALKRSLKRIKTLFVPYTFWNLVFFIFFALNDISFRQVGLKTFLFRFFFQPFNDVLWYLFTLLIFSLMAFILYPVLKNRISAIVFMILLTGAVILVTMVFGEKTVDSMKLGWWLVKILPYIPMYCFGGVIAFHLDRFLSVSVKNIPLFLIASPVLVLLKYKFDHIVILGWVLLFLSPIIFWLALPDRLFEKGEKMIGMLCEPSFFIYEVQLMAFWIWQNLLYGHIQGAKAYETAACIFALISIYIVFYLSKLLLPHHLAIATGFRSGKDFTRGKER